jgi:hypothetical protein
VHAHDDGTVWWSFVEVVNAQVATFVVCDLEVVRLERVAGKADEALVRSA